MCVSQQLIVGRKRSRIEKVNRTVLLVVVFLEIKRKQTLFTGSLLLLSMPKPLFLASCDSRNLEGGFYLLAAFGTYIVLYIILLSRSRMRNAWTNTISQQQSISDKTGIID